MRAALAALALASLFVQPPQSYRGAWSGGVRVIGDPVELDRYCRAWGVRGPERGLLTGCYIPALNLLVVPSPCDWRGPYAKLLCHEVGHANGWRH